MEIVYNLKQIDKAVNFVLEQAKFKTLIFKAEMGTGKTTLITITIYYCYLCFPLTKANTETICDTSHWGHEISA